MGILIKRGNKRNTQRKDIVMTQREDSHIQNKEKDLEDILPLLPLEDMNFDDTWFWISSITINFCYLSYSVYGSLLWQPSKLICFLHLKNISAWVNISVKANPGRFSFSSPMTFSRSYVCLRGAMWTQKFWLTFFS